MKNFNTLQPVIYMVTVVIATIFLASAIFAAANANVPDYSTINLTNDPYANFSDGWWSGTTFEDELILSIVIGESRDGLEWNEIHWGYQTSTIGTWAVGGAYDYRDLIFDAKNRKDTFFATWSSTVVGGEWWIRAYDIDGM